jgi:hypothetical protein
VYTVRLGVVTGLRDLATVVCQRYLALAHFPDAVGDLGWLIVLGASLSGW